MDNQIPHKHKQKTGRAALVMNGAAYIRVSTDDQTEFSPDAQLKAIKRYAKQNNIVLTDGHIYKDEGISGKTADKRPAFLRMIAAAKQKPPPFEVILVHKFDRFARSREDSVVYKSLLRKECGVKVVSITESIEDDKFSVILEAMLEAMAEYYSRNLADEVVKGMTEKAERGGLQTAAPLGYDAINNKLVVNEAEAKIIKIIFSKFVSREMTVRQIAMLLNDLGARTKRGNPFENRTIQYILQNPVYIGKLRWTPQKVPNAYRGNDSPAAIVRDGGHAPIIDADTWNPAQQRLAEMKELYKHRQRQGAEVRTWLKGLIFCEHCGKALVQSQARYLQCNGYSKGKCGISCLVRIDTVERLVLDALKSVYLDEIEINVIPKKNGEAATEQDRVKSALQRLHTREQRIKEAYQGGADTLAEYKENKQLLKADRNRLAARLDEIKTRLAEASGKPVHTKIKDIGTLLTSPQIGMHEKYAAAHFIIEKITFSRRDGTLQIEYKSPNATSL